MSLLKHKQDVLKKWYARVRSKVFQASNSFEVEIYGDNSKYQFDDIDMTAIEILKRYKKTNNMVKIG